MSKDFKETLKNAGIKQEWIRQAQKLTVQQVKIMQVLDSLKKDYENIYSILLGFLDMLDDKTVIIPKKKLSFFGHEYRIFQKQLDNGDLEIKKVSIYDNPGAKKNDDTKGNG
jgi:hypothetical protein